MGRFSWMRTGARGVTLFALATLALALGAVGLFRGSGGEEGAPESATAGAQAASAAENGAPSQGPSYSTGTVTGGLELPWDGLPA